MSEAAVMEVQVEHDNLPMVTPSAGAYALAAMTDVEFETRLTQMRKGRDRVRAILRAFMQEGTHYYRPPGRENDPEAQFGLSKSGAEVLCQLYGYVAEPILDLVEYGDPDNRTSPAIRVRMRCLVHLGTLNGPVVGVGWGAANTWEVKYRYRQGKHSCPDCERETLIRSKFEAKGGSFKGARPWVCLTKQGGCGKEFDPKDARIIMQVIGRVANDDSQDLENTLLKMCEKRSKVDGSITASGTSDLFTQDIEDMEAEQERPRPAPSPVASVPNARERFLAVAKQSGASKVGDVLVLVQKGTGRTLKTWKELDQVSDEEWASMLERSFALCGAAETDGPADNGATAPAGREPGDE
jgi:hypothetical protein